MHTLIALMLPIFAETFSPVMGGVLTWTQQSPTTLLRLDVNSTFGCAVDLTHDESITVAEVMIDMVDDGLGKEVPLTSGGSVRIFDAGAGDGDVILSTNVVWLCKVRLDAAMDEPEQVIEIFLKAGA